MSQVFKLSEACLLAFHAMVYLAYKNNERVSTGEIAKIFEVSEAHLSKIVQRLRKANLIKAIRGPKGGLTLNRDAKEVTLMNIYECIEGEMDTSKCLLATAVCGTKCCLFGNLVENVNDQVRNYFQDTDIASLINTCEFVERIKKEQS